MIIKKELIQREIAGDTILVPAGKTVYDSNGLFVLNEVGAFIWNHLASCDTEDDVVKALLEEYDVSIEQAENDVHEFFEKLRKLGIVD